MADEYTQVYDGSSVVNAPFPGKQHTIWESRLQNNDLKIILWQLHVH